MRAASQIEPQIPQTTIFLIMFIKGSVPGSKNSLVLIQKISKKISKKTTAEKMAKFQTETANVSTSKKTPDKKAASPVKVEKKEVKK